MAGIVELDNLDRRILDVLQDDASLSIQEIADLVGLSSNPCWRRIKRLEGEKVIERRVVLVDAKKVGLGMTAFVAIRTNQHNPAWLEQFAAGLQGIPEIIECHRMSGEIDYILKVIIKDIFHYDKVYQKLITAIPGLSDVSTTFSMERLKYGTKLDVR